MGSTRNGPRRGGMKWRQGPGVVDWWRRERRSLSTRSSSEQQGRKTRRTRVESVHVGLAKRRAAVSESHLIVLKGVKPTE